MSETRASIASHDLALHLRAPEPSVRDAAWERLIADHTRLLLAVARSFGGDRDEMMERYTYIIAKCREGDSRRLREFDMAGRASFSTWLTVAARRLCIDYERARYGRHRGTSEPSDAADRQARRRALTDSLIPERDVDSLPDMAGRSPDLDAICAERTSHLQAALEQLLPRERLLLALRFDDGLSASRIASVLGLPTPFHVYRQLSTVLSALRATLAAHGIDGSD